MSEFKIPDEWRNEFINAYIPLIAGINSVGIYKDKIEGLTTEEVYKVIYFCEVSSRKEWLDGMTRFEKPQRDLALRYLNCRGSIVPRLAIPTSVKYNKYRDKIYPLIVYLSFLSLALFLFSKYFFINLIVYSFFLLSVIAQLFLFLKSKK